MSKSSWAVVVAAIGLLASMTTIFRCMDERWPSDSEPTRPDPAHQKRSPGTTATKYPDGTGSRTSEDARDTGTVHEDGSQKTACVTFDVTPQMDRKYVRYAILDTQGSVVINNPASSKLVCLPPGHYGYAFIDAKGSWFEKRLSGFTISEDL